jgi:hypothetical protein
VFEGVKRAADEGLPKFITEIGRAVGGFDEDLKGRLVEPLYPEKFSDR